MDDIASDSSDEFDGYLLDEDNDDIADFRPDIADSGLEKSSELPSSSYECQSSHGVCAN